MPTSIPPTSVTVTPSQTPVYDSSTDSWQVIWVGGGDQTDLGVYEDYIHEYRSAWAWKQIDLGANGCPGTYVDAFGVTRYRYCYSDGQSINVYSLGECSISNSDVPSQCGLAWTVGVDEGIELRYGTSFDSAASVYVGKIIWMGWTPNQSTLYFVTDDATEEDHRSGRHYGTLYRVAAQGNLQAVHKDASISRSGCGGSRRMSVMLSPDSSLLVFGFEDCDIHFRDLKNGRSASSDWGHGRNGYGLGLILSQP